MQPSNKQSQKTASGKLGAQAPGPTHVATDDSNAGLAANRFDHLITAIIEDIGQP
jgi:hypothetical protein